MTDSPEYIEDQIEQTRRRIDGRLSMLSEELSPTQLMSGALGTSNNDPIEMANAALAKARENPLAAILLGAGAVSLLTGKPQAPDLPSSQDVKMQAKVKKAQLDANISEAKQTLVDTGDKVAKAVSRTPSLAKGKLEATTDWVGANPIASGLMAVAAGAALSSIFAARSTTSRLEASHELHEEARAKPAVPARKKVARKKTLQKVMKNTSRSTAVLGEGPTDT